MPVYLYVCVCVAAAAGGPVQLMTMPNSVPVPTSIAVSRTSSAGLAFHPLSTLTAKQGVYLLQQTTLGGATVPTQISLANATSASATNATKDAGKMLSPL